MSQHIFHTVKATDHSQVHNGDSVTNNKNIITNNNNSITNNTSFTIERAGAIGVKRDAKILSWYSSLNFEHAHTQIRDEAGLEDRGGGESEDTDYTGRWLWESETFDSWRMRNIRELWYTGMPGAGKSTLASIIIEKMINLQKILNRNGRPGRVAYAYLSHNESYVIDQLLGNLVQQVVKGDEILPRSVTDLYTEFNDKKASRKTTHGLANLIHRLSIEEPIFIIIDAIDECDAELGKDLINLLRPKGRDQSGVSLLVTSRVWRDFKYFSEHFCCRSIKADSKDLQLFVNHMFRNHGSLQQLLRNHPTIRDAMGDVIEWKCQKIFLLAKLQVQMLLPNIKLRTLSYEDLNDELKRLLPAALDLDQMYAKISERILKQRDNDKDAQRAYQILAWIVLSPRQLSMSELREAMYRDSVTRNLGDPEDQSTQSTIRDICDGLVTFYQGHIRLVHYTTQVYFSENARRLFGDFQARIACTCAAYLRTQDLEKVLDGDERGTADMASLERDYEEVDIEDSYFKHRENQRYYVRTLLSRFPLLPYTLQYLGYHLREHAGHHIKTTEDHVISVLNEGPKMAFLYRWLQLMNLIQPLDQRRLGCFQEFSPVRIYPGHPKRKPTKPLGRACAADLESTCRSPTTDTHFHSQRSHSETSGLSHVRNDSDDTLTTEDLDGFLEEIIRLLDRQPQQHHDDSNNIEASHGSHDVVENGENAEIPPAFVSTAEDHEIPPVLPFQNSTTTTSEMHFAIPTETPSKPLLAGPDRPTTSTHLAAWYGYIPVLEHFLTTQKDIDSTDEFSRRPIVVALQQGHMDAVSMCLDHGAEIDLSSVEGQKILLQVSRRKDAKHGLIRSIIRQNHDRLDILQQSDRPGLENLLKLPMFVACVAMVSAKHFSNPIRKVFRLMHYGDSIMGLYRRLNSDNVLAAAVRGDASAIARMIAKGKWNVKNDRSRLGMMSIFIAVEFGSIDTVISLIDGGVNVNIKDFDGNTPLIRAMSGGNAEMVKALLDRDADVTLKNCNRLTAWTVNLRPENEKALDLLAARGGADPNARYQNDEPVLYCHAAGGNLAFVEFLLDKGTNPSNRTRCGWAPLHWASNNGHPECVDALLRNGAEHSPLSDTSSTPLDLAIRQGHARIIDCLQWQGAKRGSDYYNNVDREIQHCETYSMISYDSAGSSIEKEKREEEETESDIIHAQDGFEAALLILEKKVSVPLQTRKKVFEFFFRDIERVFRDLADFDDADSDDADSDDADSDDADFDDDPDRWPVSDSASRRWNTIVNGLKEREEIAKLLRD